MSTDATLREVADLLFGGGGDQLLAQIAKMNPTQSDVASHKDRKQRQVTAGLSAIGATAGAGGLGYAGAKMASAGKKGWKATPTMRKVPRLAGAIAHGAKSEKGAALLLPLEVAGLGGEVMATKILHGDTTKKKPGLVKKNDVNDIVEQVGPIPTKRSVTRAVVTNPKVQAKGIETTKKAGGMLKKLPDKVATANQVKKKLKTRTRAESIAGHAAIGVGATALPATIATWNKSSKAHAAALGAGALAGAGYGALKPLTHPKKKVEKRDDRVEVTWAGEFAKADSEKQQIFGWASVIEIDGEPVLDLQGDVISADEMEKAGYSYVMKSRKGGDMHLRDNWEPIQKSDMIESFIVTDEKREAMGLPASVPTGWWVGFQVQDPQVWSDIKDGKRTGFSIHGTGKRTPA